MVNVRLLPRQMEAQQRHDRRPGVGEVIEGIRRDGNGAGELPRQELPGEEQQVQRDAHRPAEDAVGLADGGRGRVLPVRDEAAGQKCQHKLPSFLLAPGYRPDG